MGPPISIVAASMASRLGLTAVRKAMLPQVGRRAAPKRNFGGHDESPAEIIEQMGYWRSVSRYVFVGSVVFGGVHFLYALAQPHNHDLPPKYAFLHIRTKMYPWALEYPSGATEGVPNEDKNCNLFGCQTFDVKHH